MSNPKKPVPKDPPVPVETPESRMTGEGGPLPAPTGRERPQDGSEFEGTDPNHGLEPQDATEPSHEPEPHEPPD
ncbi:hypothetical protein [Streptomyces sp. FH025]|uniref:hypothetical protein n=1 Tax=Streptomyces sp. FH025 TaxID=2815937 RepID=UPI001A9F11CA|nr:hypothetical protein [Streptomyces sp. FH025]MBO1417114.1 hypothetical protein [Streptomyces sp. FH025]